MITKLSSHVLGSIKDPAKSDGKTRQLDPKEFDRLKKKYPNKAILHLLDDDTEIWYTPTKHKFTPWWKK